ncbi:MAG: xanthine dehydrogenase family protein subunit M [Halovenus sp.]
MFPSDFEYERASTVEEALSYMAEHEDKETELLAGGHSLLPTLKTGLANPDVLIDIGNIDDLSGISVDDDTISIGAMTRYSTVEDADKVREGNPIVAKTTHHIGDRQVRNRGTIGGNLAHADPASDLAGAFLATGGTAVAQSQDGTREIPAEDYFLGMYATALESDELLVQVDLPAVDSNTVGAYAKKPNPASGYPVIGIAAELQTDGERIQSAAVAANNLMDHPVRLTPTEEALTGQSVTDVSIEDASAVATDDLDEMMIMQDLEATPEYRAQLARAYTERALEQCMDELDAATPQAAD